MTYIIYMRGIKRKSFSYAEPITKLVGESRLRLAHKIDDA
ncbi:hypothetical protein DFR24_3273 [Panacagrimonas perspica]|uniref:Uncharacterized protein n=1 Tax=Panacagrimonas perspica TaxID=381431 RepID=A0A4R7P4Z4_9GAMM|nr:hypothetical protein DFR24_3273 [Panacagrimonas perspica]